MCIFVLGYRFYLFLQFRYLILDLFRQCGIYYFSLYVKLSYLICHIDSKCKKLNLGIEPVISITEENRELQERIKSCAPLQIQINFVRDENARLSWECQRYQGIIVKMSWECQ